MTSVCSAKLGQGMASFFKSPIACHNAQHKDVRDIPWREKKGLLLPKKISVFDEIIILDYIGIHFWADFKRGNVSIYTTASTSVLFPT